MSTELAHGKMSGARETPAQRGQWCRDTFVLLFDADEVVVRFLHSLGISSPRSTFSSFLPRRLTFPLVLSDPRHLYSLAGFSKLGAS